MEWRPVFLFVTSLIVLLKRHKNPKLDTLMCPFIASALQNLAGYIVRYWPIAPRDWCRPEACVKLCSCEACRSVRNFQINPTQQIGSFKYATKIRYHIQHSVLKTEDYKFETEKRGWAYTLVMYKTNNIFDRDMAGWNMEVSEMRGCCLG
jgi:hypothetical protein